MWRPTRRASPRDTDTRAFCVGKCLPWKSHRGGKCSGLHLVGEYSQGKEALVLQKARHPVPWSRPRSFTKLGETPWHSGCESSVGKRVRQMAQLFFLIVYNWETIVHFKIYFWLCHLCLWKWLTFISVLRTELLVFVLFTKTWARASFKAGEDLGGCLFLEQPYCGLYTVLVNFNHLLVGLHFILFVIWQRTHRLAGSKPALLSVVPS